MIEIADISTQEGRVALVRRRLQMWDDYRSGNSLSTPGKPYGIEHSVADAIYRSRKHPDSRDPMEVSDSAILSALKQFRKSPQ